MKADPDGEDEVMSEINMIPFIDITLVLLIIFMVMTPFLVRSQIALQLPAAGAGTDVKQEKKPPVTIQVTKDGQIYVGGVPTDRAALATMLKNADPDNTEGAVIEADRECAFDHVVEVLDATKAAGFSKLNVAVLKKAPR